MENEKDLTDLILNLSYLMRQLMEQVVAHTAWDPTAVEKGMQGENHNNNHIFKQDNEYEELAKYTEYENLTDIEIEQKIHELMVDATYDTILPILRSSPKNTGRIFENRLSIFTKYCLRINYLQNKNKFGDKYSFENDRKILIQAREKIDNKKKLIELKPYFFEMTDILMDYLKNMNLLMKYKSNELEASLEKIDFEDLKKSLYGTLLSFICLMITVHPQGKQVAHYKKYFEPLVRVGLPFAQKLDEYQKIIEFDTKLSELHFDKEMITQIKPPDELIKSQLSVSELEKIEDGFRKYEDKKIGIDEFYPTLYKLKDHFESYYDVKSQSKNIFEDLASIVRQILHKKYLVNKDTHSSEFKIIQMVIGLKEITPLEVSFVKYLPFVLKPKSN